ncbi:MAG: hypothetical protein Q8K63_09830, partial [Acidimicrobiales bacterium]|nr:hypothetical protein [Acidimicrobiales bacterium]
AAPGWLPLAAILRFHHGPSRPTHLALAMPSRLDEYAAAIAASGIPMTPPTTHPWGMRTFQVTDPWGNVLTFETVDV